MKNEQVVIFQIVNFMILGLGASVDMRAGLKRALIKCIQLSYIFNFFNYKFNFKVSMKHLWGKADILVNFRNPVPGGGAKCDQFLYIRLQTVHITLWR
jgi:hypothetical protein